jgi:hypothetical protein
MLGCVQVSCVCESHKLCSCFTQVVFVCHTSCVLCVLCAACQPYLSVSVCVDVCVCLCVNVCVCVRERERERESVCVCVHIHMYNAYMCICMCVYIVTMMHAWRSAVCHWHGGARHMPDALSNVHI